MAPKKKDASKKVLTTEDMRRLGMSDDDIARIIAERGKSAAERKQEQDAIDARRREAEQRQRRLKEIDRMKEELVKEEGEPRVAIRDEEDSAWVSLAETLTAEKKRCVRKCAELEMHRRAAEARRKCEAERTAYQETLGHLSAEERDAFITAQIEVEHQRCELELEKKERQRQRQERRLAREKAARKAQHNRRRHDSGDMDDESGEKVGGGGAATTGGRRVQTNTLEEMAEAIVSRFD